MATTFKSGPRDPVTGATSTSISPGNIIRESGFTDNEMAQQAASVGPFASTSAIESINQAERDAEERYQGFLEATGRSDTNPYGNDGVITRKTGIDPSKIDYTSNLGAGNIEAINRLAYDQYLNPIGPDGNVRGMLREGSPTQYGTVTKDPNARFGPFNRALTGKRGLTIPDLMSFRSYSGPQVGINTLSGTSGPLFPTSGSDSDPRQAVAVPDSTTTSDTSTDVADKPFDNPMNISTGTVPVGPEIDESGNVVAPGYATLTVNQDSPDKITQFVEDAERLRRANREESLRRIRAYNEGMSATEFGSGARIDDLLRTYNEKYPITGYRSPSFTDEALDNPEDFQVQAAPAATAGEQLAAPDIFNQVINSLVDDIRQRRYIPGISPAPVPKPGRNLNVTDPFANVFADASRNIAARMVN